MTYEMLPETMKNEFTKSYWEELRSHKGTLVMKRIFDIVVSLIALAVLSPFFLLLAIAVLLLKFLTNVWSRDSLFLTILM